MPTTVDPAKWIPELCDTYWATAVDSLRTSGVQIVSNVKPDFKPIGRREATQSIKNAVSTKVFRLTDETTSRVTYGDLDEDSEVNWAIQFAAGGEYDRARLHVHEATLILQRLLLLFRHKPHPEWHQIQNVRNVHDADFPDFQRRTTHFTLKRFGETLPSVIRTVTT